MLGINEFEFCSWHFSLSFLDGKMIKDRTYLLPNPENFSKFPKHSKNFWVIFFLGCGPQKFDTEQDRNLN